MFGYRYYLMAQYIPLNNQQGYEPIIHLMSLY